MDQKNFYNMFLRNRVATGTSVVDKTTGEVTPFTGDARSYWHPHTFLPYRFVAGLSLEVWLEYGAGWYRSNEL